MKGDKKKLTVGRTHKIEKSKPYPNSTALDADDYFRLWDCVRGTNQNIACADLPGTIFRFQTLKYFWAVAKRDKILGVIWVWSAKKYGLKASDVA